MIAKPPIPCSEASSEVYLNGTHTRRYWEVGEPYLSLIICRRRADEVALIVSLLHGRRDTIAHHERVQGVVS